MASRKQVTWTELRVGLFVLVGLAILASGIFYVTSGPGLGPKYRLRTYLPDAALLSDGAPVRVDGVEVGSVESVHLAPRAPNIPRDKNRNVEIVMHISTKYQDDILTDSIATLVTEGVLGNRYVEVSRGYTGTPLHDNDEVKGTEERAMKDVVERSADVLANLKALSDTVQDLLDGVQQGKGTVGKLLNDPEAYNHLNRILSNGDALIADVRAGKGTLGKIVSSDEMYTKVDKGLDSVNVILTDVRTGKGSLGKFIYDPSVFDEAKRTISNSNAMISDIRAGKGTLGKLAVDDSLFNELKNASTNIANATAKLNDNTTTAGKLFSDPHLYDNLTGLTGDMRLLIGEFRQNPKKFLHIRVSVF